MDKADAENDGWAEEILRRAKKISQGESEETVDEENEDLSPVSSEGPFQEEQVERQVWIESDPEETEAPVERRPLPTVENPEPGVFASEPQSPADVFTGSTFGGLTGSKGSTEQTPWVGGQNPLDMQTAERMFPESKSRIPRSVLEWVGVVVGALVVALLVRQFLFAAYYIPSPSMESTLSDGDRIVVNKLSYKLHDVNRGDVVVFKKPPNQTSGVNDLIKRVIALPGETLEVVDGRVYIDGGLLLEPYVSPRDSTGEFRLPPGCVDEIGSASRCTVPPGHFFVMGDNRSNSKDSRMFGPIPEGDVVGRAFLRVWPIGDLGRL